MKPSYARTVKDELARFFDEEEEYLRAELAALLNVGSIFKAGRLEFSTPNPAVARKVIILLKKLFPDAQKELATARTPGTFKKKSKVTRYVIKIFLTRHTEEFFSDLQSPKIVLDDFAKVSYLRGAFLSGGTVNKPEKQYYLDISASSQSAANFIHEIFVQLEFNPTLYTRGEFFVNYLCEGDAVEEFLGMVGAAESVEHFGITRNLKEVRANVNRLVNIETANLNKAVNAAQRQLADIKILTENKIQLGKDLRLAMKARSMFPECTISELAEKLFITKQGLVYRFKKIHEAALKVERQIDLKKRLGIKT